MARSHRRRAGRRSLARAIAGALPALVALAGPGLAEAREGLSEDTIIAIVGAGAAGADMMFFFYDVGLMSADQHASAGWSIAQTAITAPQTIAFSAMAVGAEFEGRHEEELLIPAFIGAMFTGAMTTHGIWSLASDDARALELFVISPVIAGNTVLTTAALAKATAGELGSATLGAMELGLAGPSGAYFAYRSVADKENRSSFIGLSVWSGVLLLHGAASLIAWRLDEIDDSPAAARLRLPFKLQGFGPSVVSDGVASAPGLQISGIF